MVENRHLHDGRVLQRHVLYLGELNGRQEASWRKTVDLFGQDDAAPQQVALFPDDLAPAASPDHTLPMVSRRLTAPSPLRGCTFVAVCPGPSRGPRLISFLAYALQITLKARLKQSATGLTPRAVLEKFAAVQMLDVHLPTTDGREVVLTRYTQPEKELQLLLDQLKLTLPAQPPPKITAPANHRRRRPSCDRGETREASSSVRDFQKVATQFAEFSQRVRMQ